MRDLHQVSDNSDGLLDFLQKTEGISYNSDRKVYVIDPDKYKARRVE
mgnify:CR=1 FL=1